MELTSEKNKGVLLRVRFPTQADEQRRCIRRSLLLRPERIPGVLVELSEISIAL